MRDRKLKAFTVAQGVTMLAGPKVKSGEVAEVTIDDLAKKIAATPENVRTALELHGTAIWGSLPLGWVMQVEEDEGVMTRVRVARRGT